MSTDLDLDRLRDLWQANVPVKTIAREFGCSPTVLTSRVHRLRQRGVDGLPPRRQPAELDIQKLERLWAAGAPLSYIASRFGMTQNGMTSAIARLRARGTDLPRRQERVNRCVRCRGAMAAGHGPVCGLCLAEGTRR